MNSTKPSQSSSFRDRFALLVRLEIKALLISFLLIVVFNIALMVISGSFLPNSGKYIEGGEYEVDWNNVGLGFAVMAVSLGLSLSFSLAIATFVHLSIFRRFLIHDEMKDCNIISMNERIEIAEAKFKSLFSVYSVVCVAKCIIIAPFSGGLFTIIRTVLPKYTQGSSTVWILTQVFMNKYVGGLIWAVIVSLFTLYCRANKFSDRTLYRIKIFMIIMIINYSVDLLSAWVNDLLFPLKMMLTAVILISTIFASIIYLKSYKLSMFKNAQSPEIKNGHKKLDELVIGVWLIGAVCMLWLLYVALCYWELY